MLDLESVPRESFNPYLLMTTKCVGPKSRDDLQSSVDLDNAWIDNVGRFYEVLFQFA